MTALLLVDIQNDFMPGGALPVHDGHEILPVINGLLNLPFDCIVATKDWHPADHGSFADVHNKKPGERILLAGLDQILWPRHCVQHTHGSEFAPGWDSSRVQEVFYKGTDKSIDSYSTFFDNGHRRSTGLGKYLESKGVRTVYIAGLTTEYCVKYSVLHALELDYKVNVVIDGCRGINLQPNDVQNAIDEMRACGAHIISLEDAIQKMKNRGGGI